MNNATFAGRLGRDAEIRHTQSGQSVTSFALAVDEYAGKGEKKTLWVDCSWWGERGEKLAQYLTKGSPLTVSGQVGVREYNGKAYLTLRVWDVTLMGKGHSDGHSERHERPQNRAVAPSAQDNSGDIREFDDDLPFN